MPARTTPMPLVRPARIALGSALAAGLLLTHAPARAAEGPPDAPTFADADETAPGEVDGAIRGSILVDLRDDVTAADVADVERTYGVRLTPNSPWSDAHDKIEDADVDPASEDAILARLAADPRVEHAEPMGVVRASFVPDDPLYASKQWHLKRAGAESAWDFACGRGVTVAVVDTGVACFERGPFTRGTDLAGTRCGRGYDFVNDRDEAADDHGHGTHVAGTIAQTTNNGKGVAGLAYCATLMPIKVLTGKGWGTVADVAEGIRFAADEGAQIINLSLGGPSPSGVLRDAVAHAIDRGALVVAAAGNSGGRVGYPAAYDGVVAVSATDANDRIAWFSSRGPEVTIAAPGVAVTQQTVCNGGKDRCELFGTFSGTSMASPHVAGAAALLVSEGVTRPSAVVAALEDSATAKDDAKLYGAGVLNAGAAVASAFAHRLAWRLGLLAVLFFLTARRIARRGGAISKSPIAFASMLVGATGLLPIAPWMRVRGLAGELLARPLGEWDLLWSARLHAWLPLAGALPTILFAALFFGARRFRVAVGGFALGSAALALQLAISGEAAFAFGALAMRVYMISSALTCLWIARISLDTKR